VAIPEKSKTKVAKPDPVADLERKMVKNDILLIFREKQYVVLGCLKEAIDQANLDLYTPILNEHDRYYASWGLWCSAIGVIGTAVAAITIPPAGLIGCGISVVGGVAGMAGSWKKDFDRPKPPPLQSAVDSMKNDLKSLITSAQDRVDDIQTIQDFKEALYAKYVNHPEYGVGLKKIDARPIRERLIWSLLYRNVDPSRARVQITRKMKEGIEALFAVVVEVTPRFLRGVRNMAEGTTSPKHTVRSVGKTEVVETDYSPVEQKLSELASPERFRKFLQGSREYKAWLKKFDIVPLPGLEPIGS
jgi:hypothetical protein